MTSIDAVCTALFGAVPLNYGSTYSRETMKFLIDDKIGLLKFIVQIFGETFIFYESQNKSETFKYLIILQTNFSVLQFSNNERFYLILSFSSLFPHKRVVRNLKLKQIKLF